MKIAIISANGNLGKRVTKIALERNHDIKAFIYEGKTPDERVELVQKSLFDIKQEDLTEVDVIISAYGSGFQADPAINREAFLKYIDLAKNTEKHLITIGGAGSMFTDETHTIYSYETPEHPEFLREISKNIKLGIDELKKSEGVEWTVVCPSAFFDSEGPLTGNYQISTEGHLIFNEQGKSYVTYNDLAMAMIDIAEQGSYKKMQLTVGTK